jgi:hypothetical protein
MTWHLFNEEIEENETLYICTLSIFWKYPSFIVANEVLSCYHHVANPHVRIIYNHIPTKQHHETLHWS